MSDEILNDWKAEAKALKRRDLSKDEERALDEAILEGTLKPGMDHRRRKNVIRTAIGRSANQQKP